MSETKTVRLPFGVEPKMVRRKNSLEVREGDSCRMQVTPEMARSWLKTNMSNRNLSRQNVEFIVSQLKKGKWKFNGESISFDSKGKLLNGQHRLTAVVESNQPIDTLVILGIQEEAFHTMDTGKIRTAGDILSTKGYSGANTLASVARLVISLQTGYKGIATGGLKRTNIDNEDVMKFVEQTPNFVEVVSEAHKLWSKMPVRFVAPQIFCAMYFLFYQKNMDMAKSFMTSVAQGTNIDANSPQYHLRSNLEKMYHQRLRRRYSIYQKSGLFIKAWNYYRTNKKFERLFFKENEAIQSVI